MNYKTILKNVFSNIRKNRMAALLFFASFFSLWSFQVQAQTINADSDVPVLDVCSDYQKFTVKVTGGTAECMDAILKIVIPKGFELESGSVKIDGTPHNTQDTGDNGVTTVELSGLTIPAGANNELSITYNVKALCGIIGSLADSVVNYTLTDCNQEEKKASSETINIRYGVLRMNVSPDPIIGNIGDEVTRTITIKNQGNGAVSEFILDRKLGDGLSHVSYDYPSLTAAGWDVDETGPNELIFTGGSLKTGEELTFTEKVKITNCALSPTEYEVYYGCGEKCTNSKTNDYATNVIVINTPDAPKLVVTETQGAAVSGCFDDTGSHTIIWTIINTGSVDTEAIAFTITTQDAGGYISSYKVESNAEVSVSGNATSVPFMIPALAAGARTTIEFVQHYSGLNPAQSGGCASADTMFSYARGANSFTASYDYNNSCAPVTIAGSMKGISHVSNFSGEHLGEVDFYGNPASTAGSNLEYLFTGFNVSHVGLNAGDQFVVTIDLTGDCFSLDSGATFEGTSIIVDGTNKKATITFTYGTAPWLPGTDLNFTNTVLKLPISLVCGDSCTGNYKIGGELIKKDGTSTCAPIVFQCNETALNGYCEPGNCPDTLQITASSLERTAASIGIAADADGKPLVPFASATTANTRLFLEGDLLDISQTSNVKITSGTSFSKVRLEVEKSTELSATLVEKSGKVILTRGGDDYSFTGLGLVVTETSSKYILEFDLSTANNGILGTTLQHDDVVKLSLQVKAGNGGNSLTHPLLKKFKVNSFLVDTTATPEEIISCDHPRTVTGLYVSREDKVTGNTTDFVDCTNGTNSAIFETKLSVIDGYKFDDEYRKLFKPTTAELTIPSYLDLTAVKVEIKNQPWLIAPNNERTILLADITQNGNVYTVDLATALKSMTGAVLGGGNDLDYLNEAFQLAISPVVSLKGCEPINTAKEQKVSIKLNGKIIDGAGVETDYSNQNTSEVVYTTGIGSLTLKTANNVLDGKLSPDGTEVSWTVKVESEGARNFNSVWFSKIADNLVVKSVQQVTNYGNETTIGAIIPAVNGLYELGDFTSNSPKYYIVKADVIDCEVEFLTLRVGYSCASGDYPSSNEEGCRFDSLRLTHKTIANLLQTEIVEQFNGDSSVKPNICDGIWYTVQLHNGGDSQLSDLALTIPTSGLVCTKVEIGSVYPANSTVSIPTTSIPFTMNAGILTVELPDTVKLNTLERVRVRIYFEATCNFISGSKQKISPSAINTCGTALSGNLITPATTKRILIEGGSDSFPELEEIRNEVTVDPVLIIGANLEALYNFELRNTGIGNQDAITADYKVELKLPKGWAIIGNPNDYLLPAGTATYQNMVTDPTTGIVTYTYNVIQDVPVNGKLTLKDVPLKYTPTDAVDFTCESGTVNLGDIVVKVYQNIPNIDCSAKGGIVCPNGIDQILLEESKSIILPLKDDLEVIPQIGDYYVCNPSINGGVPTLADIILEAPTQSYHLDWYANYQDADNDVQRLPLTEPLVNGRTYYVINRFIVDGKCKSAIGERRVFFKANNLSGTVTTLCSADASTYQVQVTLSGGGSYVVDSTSTGYPGSWNTAGNVWTSEPLAAATSYGIEGTPYDVTFTDANNCTPLTFTGVAPICCTLEITCPPAITVTCGADYTPSNTGAPQIVKACGSTTYAYTDSAISAVCVDGKRFFTRTFTVKDEAGNEETCEQEITIEDNVRPILGNVAQDKTVSCEMDTEAALAAWLANKGGATATDACSGDVTWSNDYDEANFATSCGVGNGSVEVTFTATDACGNTVDTTATFTVEDTTKPVFVETLPAAEISVSCDNIPTAAVLTATDGCSGTVITATFVETRVDNGSCANNYVLNRTWTATDACGNAATHTQTITVADTTAPTFTKKPESVIVECDGKGNLDQFNTWLANHGGAEAEDGCGPVFWETTHIEDTNTICGITGTVIVDFIVKDACGNWAMEQATFAIKDTVAPTIVEEAKPLVIECGVHVEDELNAWLSNFGGAIATDSCGDVTWAHDYTGNLTVCGAPIEVTFTVTDACNNKSTTKATVKVVDNVAPTLTKKAQSVTVECSANTEQALENWLANHAGAEAKDSCSIVTWTNDYVPANFVTTCGNAGSVTVIFTATDGCGNTITTTATFTIEDTTAPKFVGQLPVERMTVSCDVVPATPILVATDNCGEAVISFTEKKVGGLCANSYDLVRVWTATDSCGNATSFTQTITVEDTVAPVFTILPENLTVECDGEGNEADFNAWLTTFGNAVATDNCSAEDKLVWTTEIVNTSVLCGKTGNTVVKFTVTDECGNASSKQATFTIVDTTAPSIDTPAEALVLECGTNVDAQITTWLNNHGGAEASDACGSVTWSHNYTGLTAACGNTGNATVVFTATDSCGNTETSSATITVEDTLKPTLLKEAQGLTVQCATTTQQALENWLANHAGAEATDSCSTVVWTNDYDDSKFPTACSATDTVTVIFTATDACGNAITTTATFAVEDNEAPKFVGQLPVERMTVSCDVVPATPILVATDNCGEAVISFTEKKVGGLCANSYDLVRVWTATDSCGNATSFTQTITVEDTVAPTFVEELPTNVTVSCSADVPTAVVLTAIDNCGTADVVMTEKRVDGSCSNNYVLKRTWVATDLCGNSISHTQIIRVEDKIAPEFVGDLPANITVSCLGDLPSDTIVTATDNCGDVEVVLKETRVDGTCANSFVLTKTWTATDSCGNSVAHTQIITVDDKVAPVFVTVPQNLTVECDGQGNEADFNAWIANYADAVATDNCSTEDKLVWTTEIVNTSVLCGKTGNTVVKFTVTDECGNNVSKQAVFTVVDTAGPDFIAEAQDKTVACDGNGNANDLAAWLANHAGAKATDACSNGITWTNDFTGLDKACGSTGSATVTFTATDSCGNTSETTATFTIVDEEAPVFTTNLPQDLTLECSVEIPEAAVMNAVDACSTAEVVFTEERINGSCLGSYQLVRTWTATDSCGNAVSHVQTITIEDTTAPVFVDPLPVRELYMSCEDLQEAEELKAIDSCGTVDVTFTEETIAGECSNRYTLVRTWTATDSCGNATEFVQDIHVACKIEFTNAISANGDGVNDEFQLKGIECYPGNTVEIFNRWGKLVYSTTNYNSNGNVFKGYANTKHVVSGGEKLPTGTYFYVVKYDFSLGNGTTQSMDQSGYIHLESNK